MQDVIARWNAFLKATDGKLRAILGEAQQGCAQLLDEADLDPGPMGQAWTAMERRALALQEKVTEFWDDKIDDALDDAGAPANVLAGERRKGEGLVDHIEVQTQRMRIAIYAAAARKVWDRARAETPASMSCTQCGGAIPTPKVVAATKVTCPFCSAVNTFEPGMRVRMIESFCAHPLTEEACWNEWVAMRKAEAAMHAARSPSLAHFQAYERAQIDYWTKYFAVRAKMLPHKAKNQAADVAGRMRHYYDRIHHERAWAQAGRPRMLK